MKQDFAQVPAEKAPESVNPSLVTGHYLGAFFDELTAWGVRTAVISPGSRSTGLAMTAYELSRRNPEKMDVLLDIDERGAAFVALGLAKASGRPTVLICTSGTAAANYYPAVLEAESSRVPLIVLTGDRPGRLQGLGAPQTMDQVKLFGDHVKAFRQMPEPRADHPMIAFVRQAAREAFLAAVGDRGSAELMGSQWADPAADGATNGLSDNSVWNDGADGSLQAGFTRTENLDPRSEIAISSQGSAYGAGPVHLNFPLDEPLKPEFESESAFTFGRRPRPDALPHILGTDRVLTAESVHQVVSLVKGKRTLVLAGEGSCETLAEAQALVRWASDYAFPVLADPLSGLRSLDASCIIDTYDALFGHDEFPIPELVIRFGRYPVSKNTVMAMKRIQPFSLVVDRQETRDFNSQTDSIVLSTPMGFVKSLMGDAEENGVHSRKPSQAQQEFLQVWIRLNDVQRMRTLAVETSTATMEGHFIRKLLEEIPERSCLFSANSMAIRALDTFYVKAPKLLTVLCNRGLNGIDGTVSSAVGAALEYGKATLLTGDLTMTHDLNALNLQTELLRRDSSRIPTLVMVLMNNKGGAIFDTLPQKSDDDYFPRLFLTPQQVDFESAAHAFAVPYRRVDEPAAFVEEYRKALGRPGLSLIEIPSALTGVDDRYAPFR